MKDSQLSARIAGVPQCFLELLPQWLAIEASLTFKALWKASVMVFSRYRFKRSLNFMPRASTLWADVRVGFPSALMRVVAHCSDGLLQLHPQLSVQLWGSYGEA